VKLVLCIAAGVLVGACRAVPRARVPSHGPRGHAGDLPAQQRRSVALLGHGTPGSVFLGDAHLRRAFDRHREVSIFALSTYDTDYVMVKQSDLDRAVQALRQAGYPIAEAHRR
jgi:hypothetical protein